MIYKQDLTEIRKLTRNILQEEEIKAIERMGGMTNHTYHVVLNSGDYAIRLPGEGTEEIINRDWEKKSTELACRLDIDTEILYFDVKTGVKIGKYIEAAQTMSVERLREEENLKMVADILRTLHTCGEDTKVPFDVFQIAGEYEELIKQNQGSFYDDYEEVRTKVWNMKTSMSDAALVPCHNDPLCENWVRGKSRMYLIDWEYAGMNDPLWDVADIAIEAELDEAKEEFFLQEYFAGRVTDEDRKRYAANKVFIDFLWSLWGKTRVPFEPSTEEYARKRYERMKINLK